VTTSAIRPNVLDRATRLRMYRTMVLARTCDQRVLQLLTSGEAAFSYYPFRGQEAIPAAIGAHLRRQDYLVTTYRGLHDVVGKGVPLDEVFAEMLGRRTGTSKGKGGPMHLAAPDHGLMVTTGIVGGGLPIAVGLGLASQQTGDGRVTVVSFGDGATSIGACHEAMNLAALWRLPVVFVCQNNAYAEYTRATDYTLTRDLHTRAAGYGMRGVGVDGNDPDALYDIAGELIDTARKGGGPSFLECKTYRLQGHAFGSSMEHMDKDELAAAERNEPVGAYRARLLADGVGEEELTEIERNAAEEVDTALATAKNAEPVGVDELLTDVFAASTKRTVKEAQR